jgi:hypothetical protein
MTLTREQEERGLAEIQRRVKASVNGNTTSEENNPGSPTSSLSSLPPNNPSIHVQDDGSTISTRERVVTQIEHPPNFRPDDATFFSSEAKDKPNYQFLKNHFASEGKVSESHALWIIEKATEILKKEPNLLEVDAPVEGERYWSGTKRR